MSSLLRYPLKISLRIGHYKVIYQLKVVDYYLTGLSQGARS